MTVFTKEGKSMQRDIKNINNGAKNKRYMTIKGANPKRIKEPTGDAVDDVEMKKADQLDPVVEEGTVLEEEIGELEGFDEKQESTNENLDEAQPSESKTSKKTFLKRTFKREKTELTFDQKYNPENKIPRLLQEQIRDYKTINDFDRQAIERADKIKYRGPLSYRFIRIIAMVFVLLPFILLRVALDMPDSMEGVIDYMFNVFDFLEEIALPMFLIAAFCFVLNKPREVRGRLIIYFVFALAIYCGIMIAFYRYAIPLIEKLNPSLLETANLYAEANQEILATFGSLINYNIFIDLFLCTLFFFFTNYTPKNLGKKGLKVFRACAIIPVLYVIASVIVYGLFKTGSITLSVWSFALLTCRTPASYIVFFALSLYLQYRKYNYLQRGGTDAGYGIYFKTKACSLHFSIYCSIVLAIVSLVDFLLSFIPGAETWLIGSSYNMVFIIPFVMLLSYSREHKNATLDSLMPFVFVCAMIFFILDIAFRIALHFL